MGYKKEKPGEYESYTEKRLGSSQLASWAALHAGVV